MSVGISTVIAVARARRHGAGAGGAAPTPVGKSRNSERRPDFWFTLYLPTRVG